MSLLLCQSEDCHARLRSLRFRRKIQINAGTRAAQDLGPTAWRNVEEALASAALEMSDQLLKGCHDGLEVLTPKIRPFVVMHGLVDGPLLDAHSAVRRGERVFPAISSIPRRDVCPCLGGVGGFAVEFPGALEHAGHKVA
jgi:hypothetical protein